MINIKITGLKYDNDNDNNEKAMFQPRGSLNLEAPIPASPQPPTPLPLTGRLPGWWARLSHVGCRLVPPTLWGLFFIERRLKDRNSKKIRPSSRWAEIALM